MSDTRRLIVSVFRFKSGRWQPEGSYSNSRPQIFDRDVEDAKNDGGRGSSKIFRVKQGRESSVKFSKRAGKLPQKEGENLMSRAPRKKKKKKRRAGNERG